jgi:hypothetical protein
MKTLQSGYADTPIIKTMEELNDYVANSWVDYTYMCDFDNDRFCCNSCYVDTLTNLKLDWYLNFNRHVEEEDV